MGLEQDIAKKLYPHLELREGRRHKVYKDSLGFLTGGVGHLIRAEDGYKFGEQISSKQINNWLHADAARAIAAAMAQGEELGTMDTDLLTALAAVNFQLGTAWTVKFKHTWAAIKNKDYDKAIHNLQVSLWAKQTPVRVQDFVNALRQFQQKRDSAKLKLKRK